MECFRVKEVLSLFGLLKVLGFLFIFIPGANAHPLATLKLNPRDPNSITTVDSNGLTSIQKNWLLSLAQDSYPRSKVDELKLGFWDRNVRAALGPTERASTFVKLLQALGQTWDALELCRNGALDECSNRTAQLVSTFNQRSKITSVVFYQNQVQALTQELTTGFGFDLTTALREDSPQGRYNLRVLHVLFYQARPNVEALLQPTTADLEMLQAPPRRQQRF